MLAQPVVELVHDGLSPQSPPAHLGWAGRRLPRACAVVCISSGTSPKESGNTCGCNSQVSNVRLVLDLILGISEAGWD